MADPSCDSPLPRSVSPVVGSQFAQSLRLWGKIIGKDGRVVVEFMQLVHSGVLQCAENGEMNEVKR